MTLINASAKSNHTLLIIFLTIFIDMIGIGILIPVFPMLIVPKSEFNILPLGWTTTHAYIMAGWLLATFSLAQFFSSPIIGQLADKFGRKKILAFSISGTMLGYLLFALAIYIRSIPLMFISRMVDGISGGNISIAQTVIGDVSTPQSRAKNFGFFGVAIGIGFVAGPFLGGKLSDPHVLGWFNATTPFLFTALLSILNVLLVLTKLPETLTVKVTTNILFTKPLANIKRIFSHDYLKIMIPVIFLFNAGFTFFTTFWGIVLVERFDQSPSQVGNFFAFLGIMIILMQGLVVRRMSGKVIDYKVLKYSIFLTSACFFGYFIAPTKNNIILYYITPFLALSSALTRAFLNSLLTRLSPIGKLGEVMGASSSAIALANSLPSILAGYIATQHVNLSILASSLTCLSAGWLFIYKFKASNYTQQI